MATDGHIRIRIDGEQAAQQADKVKQSLVGVDQQAKTTNASVGSLSNAIKEANTTLKSMSASTDKMASALNSTRTYTGKSLTELRNLNATVQQLVTSQQRLNVFIEQSANSFRQQAAGATTATKSMQNSTVSARTLATQLGITNTAANLLRTTMLAFGTGLTFAYAAHTLVEFDHAMAQVQAITKSVGTEMDILRDKAKELGADTIYSSGEAALGMMFLAQSGFTVNEMLTASSQVLALAQAGNIGLAEAAEISAKALRGFRLEAWQMGDVADVMAAATSQSTMNIQELGYAFKYVAPVSASLGVNIRETSAAIGLLSDAGIDATMAGTALRRIMSELQGPTRVSMQVLKAHGLTLADVDISTRGLIPVMETLAKANFDIGESFTIFGQRGGPAFETISQQVDKLKEKTVALDNVTGEVLKRQEIMGMSLYAAFKEFTSALEFFWIQLSEGSGLLDGIKAAFFGLHDAILFVTENMALLTPLFMVLGGVAIKAVISGMVSLIGYFAALGPVAVPSLTAATVGTAALNAQMTAGIVLARTGAAATALWTRALAAMGGPIGIGLMALGTALAFVVTHEDAATRAGEEFNAILEAQKKGADATATAMKNMSDQIKGMQQDQVRVAQEENRKLMEGWDGLKRQMMETNTWAISFNNSFSDFFSAEAGARFRRANGAVSAIRTEFLSGAISVEQFKEQLQAVGNEYNNPALSKTIVELTDLANKMDIAKQKSILLEAQMAILNGTLENSSAAVRAVAEEMKTLVLVQGELGSKIMNAATDASYELAFAKMEKSAASAHKTLYNLVGADVYEGLVLSKDAMNQWQVSTIGAEEALKRFGREVAALSPSVEQSLETVLNSKEAVQALKDQQKQATTTTRQMASATEDLAKEVARLTMTDKEFQSWEFLTKLDDLERKLGGVNPQIQMLRDLMAQAQAVGLDSPKQIIEVETQYNQFKQFGSAKDLDIQLAQLDVKIAYLQEKYKNNEAELTRITEFGEKTRAEIRSKNKDKDTQTQLSFWKDYMSMSGRGEQEYTAALEVSLQNQAQAYKDAGVDIVAVEAWVQYQRLMHSKKAEDGITRGLMALSAKYGDQAAMMEEVVTTTFSELNAAMADWLFTGELSFENFVNNVGRMLANLAVQALILKPILSFMGFADGGVFSGGRVTAFASGGVVSSPTLFPMQGGLGLMGEAGPEAIVPLTRMPSGRLGIESTGAGGIGNFVLNNTNYFDFSGGNGSAQASGNNENDAKLAEQISDSVQASLEQFVVQTILKQSRPGGILNRPN